MPSHELDDRNALTSLTAAKLVVNLSTAGSTQWDSQLANLIDAVSHEFNAETGRLLRRRTLTEYYDGNGKQHLYLNQFPINTTQNSSGPAIDVRVVDSRQNFGPGSTEFSTAVKVLSSELVVKSSEGRIEWPEGVFTRGRQNIQVTYNAGYDVSSSGGSTSRTALPPDLRNALHDRVAFRWYRNEHNRHGVSSITDEQGSVSYGGEPEAVASAIMRHRDHRFG